MRRKEAFSFSYFHEQCRAPLASAFAPADAIPEAMARVLERIDVAFAAPTCPPSTRLRLLKPLFDAEASATVSSLQGVC